VAIKITLDDGNELVVQATLDQWDAAFQRALEKNGMLEIELPDGSIKPIDPRWVRAFREEPEAESELRERFDRAEAAAG
jgi:hypothetical protein